MAAHQNRGFLQFASIMGICSAYCLPDFLVSLHLPLSRMASCELPCCLSYFNLMKFKLKFCVHFAKARQSNSRQLVFKDIWSWENTKISTSDQTTHKQMQVCSTQLASRKTATRISGYMAQDIKPFIQINIHLDTICRHLKSSSSQMYVLIELSFAACRCTRFLEQECKLVPSFQP